ncbi:MAG: DUF4198 domain-containing protein [Gemmatimonadaceae bacterium]
MKNKDRVRTTLRVASLQVAVVAAVLGSASLAAAHDFFLVPGAFPYTVGTDVEVSGQTSSRFPASVAPVALARIATATMIGADGESRITDLSHRGTSLLLRARPVGAGQRIVAVSLVPRSSRQTGEAFLRWLKLEGASDAAAHIERDGAVRAADSITRTDTKHAKTLIEVGSGGPRVFSRASGQAIEFMPDTDPSTLRPGDSIGFRVTFRGQPLPGVAVHAGPEAPADTTVRSEPDVHLVSDSLGRVRMAVPPAGLWNIRTINVVQAGPAAWETHWATFVFRAGR